MSVKPKEFRCYECGNLQYTPGKCFKCGSKTEDIRERSLSFWEEEYGIKMAVTKLQFAKMIANYSIKSVDTTGDKILELGEMIQS